MKLFGNEVHDTALVFIAIVVLQCLVGGAMGSSPSQTYSKLIVIISALIAFIYWAITYRSSRKSKK